MPARRRLAEQRIPFPAQRPRCAVESPLAPRGGTSTREPDAHTGLLGEALEEFMLRTKLCAGSVVPIEDRALSLSLSTALRGLTDETPQVKAAVLNRQGDVYRTISVDGIKQFRAVWDCFSRLRYTRRFGDQDNLSFFEPPSSGNVYFLANVERL